MDDCEASSDAGRETKRRFVISSSSTRSPQALGHATRQFRQSGRRADATQKFPGRIPGHQSRSNLERRFYLVLCAVRIAVSVRLPGRQASRRRIIEETEILFAGVKPPAGRTAVIELALAGCLPKSRELITLKHLDGLLVCRAGREGCRFPAGTCEQAFIARKQLQTKLSRKFHRSGA